MKRMKDARDIVDEPGDTDKKKVAEWQAIYGPWLSKDDPGNTVTALPLFDDNGNQIDYSREDIEKVSGQPGKEGHKELVKELVNAVNVNCNDVDVVGEAWAIVNFIWAGAVRFENQASLASFNGREGLKDDLKTYTDLETAKPYGFDRTIKELVSERIKVLNHKLFARQALPRVDGPKEDKGSPLERRIFVRECVKELRDQWGLNISDSIEFIAKIWDCKPKTVSNIYYSSK